MKLAMILLVAMASVAARSPSEVRNVPLAAEHRRNPLEADPLAQRAGAKLYARECAGCHGPHREGRRGAPPLNRPEIQQMTPGALFRVLRDGSLHHGMPSFAHLPEPQRWQIVTFLKAARE